MLPKVNPLPTPPERDPDKDKIKYPHGRYEDAPYHKAKQSGQKNPAPKNGQQALNNSVSIGNNSSRRIGVSDGNFVVLDKTCEGLYHGHMRTWQELSMQMRNALITAKLANHKGRILWQHPK